MQQDHLLHFREAAGFETIEVNAGGQAFGVPRHLMLARFELAINQRGDLLAITVKKCITAHSGYKPLAPPFAPPHTKFCH